MNISKFFSKADDEKPLDVVKDDGGFTCIFRTIAVIGDSLASGDLESMDFGGPKEYHDYFDISWGQYLARMSGTTVYNFSRGNMTASEYVNSFADSMGYWDKEKAAQAYILALGCNDLDKRDLPVGSTADIDPDWHRNAPTFAGYFAKIIQRYREIQPDGVFFLVTMPVEPEPFVPADLEVRYMEHRKLMYELAECFSNTYVIDLTEYGPAHDAEFREIFYTGGHLNSAGYYLIAKMIGSYIDYIVRHNIRAFNQSGLIGTPYKYCE
ncbi:MAG: SGNH/GDSL hydrolase family protein [Clostridia bacterium]|nr:SGNH/GDSL hydrolase family protein [Clostridia bacterium]